MELQAIQMQVGHYIIDLFTLGINKQTDQADECGHRRANILRLLQAQPPGTVGIKHQPKRIGAQLRRQARVLWPCNATDFYSSSCLHWISRYPSGSDDVGRYQIQGEGFYQRSRQAAYTKHSERPIMVYKKQGPNGNTGRPKRDG